MDLHQLDLNLMMALHLLLKERSVTQAAQKLGKTQSALSHTLNRLRDMFDDPLLVRSGSQMVLTSRAQDLRPKLQDAMTQLEQVIAPPEDFTPSTLQHTFRLISNDWADAVMLPRLLARLAEEAPGVHIQCTSAALDAEQAIQQRSADLMIASQTHELSGLLRQTLYEDTLVCMVSEKHFGRLTHIDLKTYASAQHIGITHHHQDDPIDAALRAHDITRQLAVSVPHYNAAPLIVAQSPYILTLPKRLAHTYECLGLYIKCFDLPVTLPRLKMSALFHQSKKRDAAHTWLRRLIVEVAQPPVLSLCDA